MVVQSCYKFSAMFLYENDNGKRKNNFPGYSPFMMMKFCENTEIKLKTMESNAFIGNFDLAVKHYFLHIIY